MDQDTAVKLFEEGAFLILLNVPQGTEFGMDWNSWLTGPLFKGVKMIPPGLHFVFYSAVNKHGGSNSPRTGFYHNFKLREIIVAEWDSAMEEISFLTKSEQEIAAVRASLKDMDKNLAPYPYDTLKKWISLTDKITSRVSEKLNPDCGKILSVPELIPQASSSTNADNTKRQNNVDDQGLPILETKPGTEIKFTKIPKKWYPDGASPGEMSLHSMDSSYVMDRIINDLSQPDDMLGELQYAFISFVLGQALDAFEQWKNIVHILCSCDKSLSKYLTLYENFLTVVYHQINEIPKDFFVDIVTSNNFLVGALSTLFGNIEGAKSDSASLHSRSKQFKKYLTKKFKWDFDCEPDDWAPVVVST